MSNENDMITEFVKLIEMMGKGFEVPGIDSTDVAKAIAELVSGKQGPVTGKVIAAVELHEPDACDDCDDCDDDDSLDTELAEMIEDAILEDDKDYLIKSLTTALMLTGRAAGFVNVSAVAHSIWVEQ